MSQDSYLERFLQDEQRGLLNDSDNLKRKESAPSLFFPTEDELSVQDRYFSTQHKPLHTPTQCFERFSTVLENDEDDEYAEEPEVEEEDEFLDLSQRMDETVKDLRRHLKVMIPYFPELARLISWRPSIYFLHMLWFIREKMNKDTGVAVFCAKRMAHYLAISPRTEQRIRSYFVKRNVFHCNYNRHRHTLEISINWEGLNTFLTQLNPQFALFPVQTETPSTTAEKHVVTSEEKSCLKSFKAYVHENSNHLNPQQILTAVEDLDVVPLFSKSRVTRDFRYLNYDHTHPLRPYFDASSNDMTYILQLILRNAGHLIPIPRDLEDCPSYYYKGYEVSDDLYASFNGRAKVTYHFTRRLAHLIPLAHYATMIGHMSIVEWNNQDPDKPEFLIATRNGVMATILGCFFSSFMYKFKDNFRFQIIPLEGALPYPRLMT